MNFFKKTYFAIVLSVFSFSALAQTTEPSLSYGKNLVSVGILQYSTSISLNYQYSVLNWQKQKLSTGFGLGIAYDGNFGGNATFVLPEKGVSLPIYLFLEKGAKHVVGINMGYSYKAYTFDYLVNMPITGGTIEYAKIYVDYNAAFASLYYRFHFGKNGMYNVGLTAQAHTFFGDLYDGFKVNIDNKYSLGLNFGVRF